MRNQLMAEYLRDPKTSLFEGMLKEGTSTAPVQSWQQGLARALQGGLGGYMAGRLRGEYEEKGKAAEEERKKAMDLAMGKDFTGAMSLASSPYNEDLQGTFFNAKLGQDQQAAQQEFLRQQQQQTFAQQKALAEMTAARQEAAQREMLQRQIDLAKWQQENDPQKQFLKSIFQNTAPQVNTPTQGTQPIQGMTPIPTGPSPTLGEAGIAQPYQQQGNIDPKLTYAITGKIPEGYAIGINPNTGNPDIVPYVSPKEQASLKKLQQENEQAQRAKQETEASMINNIIAGRNLASDPNLKAGVGVSSIMAKFPGTAARDFNANLDAFKAKNFLPAVQQLRGLGALSENEGKKLVDAIGALDSGMSESAFIKSLNQINSDLEEAAKRSGLQIPLNNGSAALNQQKTPTKGFKLLGIE